MKKYKKCNDNARCLIDKLKFIRKSEGISQRKLRMIAGIENAGISRMESGEITPNLDTFCDLVDAVGYKLELVKKEENDITKNKIDKSIFNFDAYCSLVNAADTMGYDIELLLKRRNNR